MSPIRVVVADDEALIRGGLVAILSTDEQIAVVGVASDGAEAVACIERLRPDVALVDLRMPKLDGIEVIRRAGLAVPACRCVVLTTFVEDALIFGALRAGAAGYLLKDLTAEDLLGGLHAIARGESVLTPAVTARVIAEFVRSPPREPAALTTGLSPREREVLAMLGRGASNKQIASALFIAEGTVKNHVTALLDKLGVSDRTQAAVIARELGLIR